MWLNQLQPVEDDDALAYLYRRGVSDELRDAYRVSSWCSPSEPIDDAAFVSKFGVFGERLEGLLIFPFTAPSGRVVGFEARSYTEKRVFNFRSSEASWNACWLGLTIEAMGRIWAGEDVWISEGFFDLVALARVIPDVSLSSTHAGLSNNHVNFLSRFVRGTVHMCYDNDVTGQNQTYGYTDPKTGRFHSGAVQRLKRAGVRVVVETYAGKDPGAVWDRGGDVALQREFGRK